MKYRLETDPIVETTSVFGNGLNFACEYTMWGGIYAHCSEMAEAEFRSMLARQLRSKISSPNHLTSDAARRLATGDTRVVEWLC